MNDLVHDLGRIIISDRSETASASYMCMATIDLCRKIATYCDCLDLLQLESTSRLWQETVLYQFHLIRDLPNFRIFAFKSHTQFNSDKRICSRLSNLRRRKDSFVYLFGGSFLTPIKKSCKLSDSSVLWDTEPSGHDLPVDLGASASTTDVNGNFLVIGGFSDMTITAVDAVRLFDVRNPEQGWVEVGSLCRPRCFGSAVSTISGDILHIGGGSSPYQGGRCYSNVYLCKAGEFAWEECAVPSMSTQRCGHSAVTLYSDNILVMGGYGGGTTFHRSVEMLDRAQNKWVTLPPMSAARSGMFATLGPDGAVYVAGGSPDGVSGHKSTERYDPREGKWQELAEMNVPRGYTTGCVSILQSGFCVIGGINSWNYSATMEFYDFRMNSWAMVDAADGRSEWLGRATALMTTNF